MMSFALEMDTVLIVSWIWLGFCFIIFIYEQRMIDRAGVIETDYTPLIQIV